MDVPKGISDDEEGDILLVCVVENGVAVGFDHVPIGEEDGFTIKCFLGVERDQGVKFRETCVDRLARRSFWTIRMLV